MDQETSTVNTAAPAPANPSTSVSVDDQTLAVVAHVGGLLTSFVVPLIIWLIQKDKNSAASKHALEALNFQITVIIGSVVGFLLSIVLIGFLIIPAVYIIDLVFCIMAAVAASKNEPYRYPISIRLIK